MRTTENAASAAAGGRRAAVTTISGKATGAVLMQDQGRGLQPMAFMSKKMTDAEMNYSTRDQEFLAIMHACRQ